MRLNERMKYETAVNSIRLPRGGTSGLGSSIGGYASFRNARMRSHGQPTFNMSSVPRATYGTSAAMADSFDSAFARLKENREAEQKEAAGAAFKDGLQRSANIRRAVEASGVAQLGGSSDSTPYHLIREWESKVRSLEEQLARSQTQHSNLSQGVQSRALGMAERDLQAKDQTIFALQQQAQEYAAEVEALRGKSSIADLKWKDKIKRLEANFEQKARDCDEWKEKVDEQRVEIDRLKKRDAELKRQVADMKGIVAQAEDDLQRAAESPELANLRAELARSRRENQALRSTNTALEDAQAELQQRVTSDVTSMHHLNERVRSLQQQLEQRKLRGLAEEEMSREIEDLRRNLANAKAREEYAKTTIAVEIEAVNHKMTQMQHQLQVEEAKSKQADRLRAALAQREHELSEFESRARREADQRDQTERTLRDKNANLQLDIANLKQQHEVKISHMDRELQAANEAALAAKDELFTAKQRAESASSQLQLLQRESAARNTRSHQTEVELQEELKIMDDTLERRANQLKEMKRAHEEETAELREQLSQAKSRDRATAEALHDESSRVLDLQQRLKLSREQNLALESAVREHSDRADKLQARLDQLKMDAEETNKENSEQRQGLSLENQRLAFDLEGLKQKEASLKGTVASLQKEVETVRADLEAERRKSSERAAVAEKKLAASRAALEEEQLKHIREVATLRESGMQIADSTSSQLRERFEKSNRELLDQIEELRAQNRSDRAAADTAERIGAEKLAAAELEIKTLQLHVTSLQRELDTARSLNTQLRAAEQARITHTSGPAAVPTAIPTTRLPSSPRALGAAAAAFPHKQSTPGPRLSTPAPAPAVSASSQSQSQPEQNAAPSLGPNNSVPSLPTTDTPTDLSASDRSKLEAKIYQLLEADEEGTLSFKDVRLQTCAHFDVTYDSSEWKRWFKATAETCIEKIEALEADDESAAPPAAATAPDVKPDLVSSTPTPSLPRVKDPPGEEFADEDSWDADGDGGSGDADKSSTAAMHSTSPKKAPSSNKQPSAPQGQPSPAKNDVDEEGDSWDDSEDGGANAGANDAFPLHATDPSQLTKSQLSFLEREIYAILEADVSGTVSFKQLRLDLCARVPGGPATYSSSAWKKWFKAKAEKCLDEIEDKREQDEKDQAEKERLSAAKEKERAAAAAAAAAAQSDEDEDDSWDDADGDAAASTDTKLSAKRPTEQGAASPSRQKKLVFPPAAAPDDLTDAHRKQLAAHIRSELEVDPDAPLSFKTVRLNVCDKVKQTYGSTAWKKWFKTQTEDALDEMEGDDAGLPDNRQSAVPVASPSPRKAPAIAKLERTPAASTAESLKAARDLIYDLLLKDEEGVLTTKKLRYAIAEKLAANPEEKLNNSEWKQWFKTTATECVDKIEEMENGDGDGNSFDGSDGSFDSRDGRKRKETRREEPAAPKKPDHDNSGPDASNTAYLKKLTDFIFKVVEEDEDGMITMKQVRAQVAEKFNNNDFTAKPWKTWMKASVQDAIDRLEEMTDIDATDADADAPTATPSGKASAALRPAPSVDTCSDEFIDKAEDEIQAEMDRHYDNAKKGEELSEVQVRKHLAKVMKYSFEAKEWVEWIADTIEDFKEDDAQSDHSDEKSKGKKSNKNKPSDSKSDPWSGKTPKDPKSASPELLAKMTKILRKAVAKDVDGTMEIDEFQDAVEDSLGRVFKGDKWADWFDDMVEKLDAELHPSK